MSSPVRARCVWSTLVLVVSFVLAAAPSATSGAILRNVHPDRDFAIVEVPVVSMNITAGPGWTGGSTINYHPTFGGVALPLSSNADFSIDVPIMLPNSADDPEGCNNLPWKPYNEFGQVYNSVGAFVLIRESMCTYSTYIMAAMSGAAGVLVYGCPGEKPYNCKTQLHEILIYFPIPVPVIAISSADGEAMVAYLQAAKVAANGTAPPVSTLMARFISTGNIVPEERAALVGIMSQSQMGGFNGGNIPDAQPLWNVTQLATDMSFDPCRDRIKGLWCEAGHVVIVSVYYQEWYNFALINGTVAPPVTMPKEFGLLTHLRYLNLQLNALGGPIPEEWCALTDLRSLWLDQQYRVPGITSLPECIGNWTKIEEFRLYNVGLLSVPNAISTFSKLRKLHVGTNQLTSLPDVSGLAYLEEFDASVNQLTVLPLIHPAAPLTAYAVANNLFTGVFPVDFFDGRILLQYLDINSNQFSGPLPNLLGCTSLLAMDLGSQRDVTVDVNGTGTRGFTGAMPLSWTLFKSLQQLYLQENLLVGPMYAFAMLSLEYLDVSWNLITYRVAPNTDNIAGFFLNDLTSPSAISVRASYNPTIYGALSTANFLIIKSMRELYMDHCSITDLTKELFLSTVITADFSYNNLSLHSVKEFPILAPPIKSTLLDVRGNPFYTFDSLPFWSYPDTSRVQLGGTNYACAPLKSAVAPLMNFLVDPEFYKYKYCECAPGTFGRPPLCSHIPSSAQLNPVNIITSDEIGISFPTLISQTGGVGGGLYELNPDGTPVVPTHAEGDLQLLYAQSFSDSMYGENRLTLGMATSWVIDLTNLFGENMDCVSQVYESGDEGIATICPTPLTHAANASLGGIPSTWTPVHVITVRLHISATHFTQFEDGLNIFEGGSDLKGNRVLALSGTDAKPKISSSDYTTTPQYLLQHNASISKIDDPRLLEIQVFSTKATVQFTSRANSGLHFYATYSYDFVCPNGYFYNTMVSPAQCHVNYSQFDVGSGIRGAVFAVSAIALAWVLFNIVILLWKWESPVYKAASRVFMLLMLILLLAMPLGSLLYATIPEVGTSLGAAVCQGRAWLTCLPLAGVLAVMLAKTNRLDSIFGAAKLQVKKHSDWDILKVVLVVCFVQVGLLAIFSGLPLSRPVLELGKGGLGEKLVTSCSQESGFMSWFGGEVAFMGLLMLPAAYLGFKTRDLPSKFNESAHIQNALLLLMFFGCIIIPLDIFIQDTPEAAVLIQGLGQAFLCIVLTGIIFGPKLYYLTTSAGGRSGSIVDERTRQSGLSSPDSHEKTSHERTANVSSTLNKSTPRNSSGVPPPMPVAKRPSQMTTGSATATPTNKVSPPMPGMSPRGSLQSPSKPSNAFTFQNIPKKTVGGTSSPATGPTPSSLPTIQDEITVPVPVTTSATSSPPVPASSTTAQPISLSNINVSIASPRSRIVKIHAPPGHALSSGAPAPPTAVELTSGRSAQTVVPPPSYASATASPVTVAATAPLSPTSQSTSSIISVDASVTTPILSPAAVPSSPQSTATAISIEPEMNE